MNTKLLVAAAAMGLAAAGQQVSQPTAQPTETAKADGAKVSIPPRKPTSVSPVTPRRAASQQVFTPAPYFDYIPRYVERTSRRRVKYGKSRWVALG